MRRLETGKESHALSWLVTASGILLPLIGVAAALYGCFKLISEGSSGLYWIGAGAVLIIADMVIDSFWPRTKDAIPEDLDRE